MNPTLTDKSIFKSRVPDSVSAFIKKTFDMLEDQKFPDIVDWNPEGTAIIIKKPIEFGQKVLPAYFKHSNLTSFVRQLNMYDFHKRRTQKYDHVYYHDLFQRDKRNLLQEIKRKSQETALANIQKAIEGIDITQAGEAGSTYESQLLKKLNKDAIAKIAALENKVKDLTAQNQSLCNQITQHQQKEDLLVSFMASFMKTKGITLDQLPTVLNSQFNLPPVELAPGSKLFKEKDSGFMVDNIQDNIKQIPSFNPAEFFNFEENLNKQIEHPRRNTMEYNVNLPLNRDILGDINHRPDSLRNTRSTSDQGWNIPPNKGAENWSLLSKPEKSFCNSNERGFDKRGSKQRETNEKRNFHMEEEEEVWSTQKPPQQNPYNRILGTNPFMSGVNNNSSGNEDVSFMKISKNDSLTDKFLNLDTQHTSHTSTSMDLLDFEV